MADEESSPTKKTTTKKKGLPPLSPRNNDADATDQTRPVRRKKKKPAETTENGHANGGEEKPTPRRRAKSAPPGGKAEETGGDTAEDTTLTTPKKKKRKPKPKGEGDEPPASDRSGTSAPDDVGGSKTSLIKDDGTPRKKGKKKKGVKKAKEDQGDTGPQDYSFFGEDLTEISEDVVTKDTKEEEEEPVKQKTSYLASTTAQALRSQPLEKVFIETNRGFKGYNKAQLTKRMIQEQEEKKAVEPEKPRKSTLEFGLSTHKVFKTICLFLHGLTAGLALWEFVIVYVLARFPDTDFLDHYDVMAMPVQCIFYVLFALCTVSACDRFDIGNPTRRFVVQALTLQNGAVSIVIYLAGLILSLATIDVEDRMHLRDMEPMLWNSTSTTETELEKFRSLNTARGVAAILGWLVIAIGPNTDRLSKNLHEGDDEILAGEMELDSVSPA